MLPPLMRQQLLQDTTHVWSSGGHRYAKALLNLLHAEDGAAFLSSAVPVATVLRMGGYTHAATHLLEAIKHVKKGQV